MTKVRRILGLVVSLVLFSGLLMAQPQGNNKDKNKEHHSRLAKVAFWRHFKKDNKKQAQAQSKPTQAKAAQMKPAAGKATAEKKDHKQEQHASNTSKSSSRKAATGNKKKQQEKADDAKTALLKQ